MISHYSSGYWNPFFIFLIFICILVTKKVGLQEDWIIWLKRRSTERRYYLLQNSLSSFHLKHTERMPIQKLKQSLNICT